ncbi:MAG: energy-coupling factor ABC transporter ATP-binding protein [Treponema sp.]|nr:energy-coupling factor ABC transporter ATP-binding protein [Treponema sp.]
MNKAIELSNITKRFPLYDDRGSEQVRDGFFYALDDVSLSIEDGECAIIAGANGSGKSILMSIVAGLEEPTLGTVKTSARVGLVFQEPDAQILGETPQEDVAFGPRNLGFSKTETNLRVENALFQTGLSLKAGFPARTLSGGEKRRLAAAGVLAMDAQIIIFDEPYANMDYPGVLQVNCLFKELILGGKTLIILTHELEKCMSLANRFIVLYKGKKVYDADVSFSEDIEKWGIRNPLRKGLIW